MTNKGAIFLPFTVHFFAVYLHFVFLLFWVILNRMSKKPSQRSLINRIASKRILEKNIPAFEAYGNYRKAADIIERAEFAAGKRVTFKAGTGSTLNFEINRYGAYSTTTQTI